VREGWQTAKRGKDGDMGESQLRTRSKIKHQMKVYKYHAKHTMSISWMLALQTTPRNTQRKTQLGGSRTKIPSYLCINGISVRI